MACWLLKCVGIEVATGNPIICSLLPLQQSTKSVGCSLFVEGFLDARSVCFHTLYARKGQVYHREGGREGGIQYKIPLPEGLLM